MLKEKVRKTIEEHTLIRKGDHIVLGLSGGPDSVCLFNVLRDLAGEMELKIVPVHVNHMFRPGAADKDQEYVERICREAGLECRSFTVDCNALAEEKGLTGEEAGREARYEAFYAVAGEIAGSIAKDRSEAGSDEEAPDVLIAVAQNANDQAETILHRIIRGTGPDGLSGIAYKRYEKDVPVIRPLLDITREEIEEYCRENRLDPVTDHTNSEPVYLRNRIRLELLPLLEKYNSNIVETLARLARIAAADREHMGRETEEALSQALIREEGMPEEREPAVTDEIISHGKGAEFSGPGRLILDRAGLAGLDGPIRHRTVRLAFEKIGLAQDITEERLVAADAIILKKQAPKTVQFPHGYRLTVARGEVIFSRT